MDDSMLEIDSAHGNTPRIRLERIPSPFVWTPREPIDMHVAVVGGSMEQRADTAIVLRSSGHHVTPYASADVFVQCSRQRDRPVRRQLQPHAVDVVVLHGAPIAAIVALELLRAHAAAIPIVLITDDDADVLAEAKRLCVEEVLVPPVHPVALRAAVAAVVLPVDAIAISPDAEEF